MMDEEEMAVRIERRIRDWLNSHSESYYEYASDGWIQGLRKYIMHGPTSLTDYDK